MKKRRLFPPSSAKDAVLVIYPVRTPKGTYKFRKVIVHKDKVKEAVEVLTKKSKTT